MPLPNFITYAYSNTSQLSNLHHSYYCTALFAFQGLVRLKHVMIPLLRSKHTMIPLLKLKQIIVPLLILYYVMIAVM